MCLRPELGSFCSACTLKLMTHIEIQHTSWRLRDIAAINLVVFPPDNTNNMSCLSAWQTDVNRTIERKVSMTYPFTMDLICLQAESGNILGAWARIRSFFFLSFVQSALFSIANKKMGPLYLIFDKNIFATSNHIYCCNATLQWKYFSLALVLVCRQFGCFESKIGSIHIDYRLTHTQWNNEIS